MFRKVHRQIARPHSSAKSASWKQQDRLTHMSLHSKKLRPAAAAPRARIRCPVPMPQPLSLNWIKMQAGSNSPLALRKPRFSRCDKNARPSFYKHSTVPPRHVRSHVRVPFFLKQSPYCHFTNDPQLKEKPITSRMKTKGHYECKLIIFLHTSGGGAGFLQSNHFSPLDESNIEYSI